MLKPLSKIAATIALGYSLFNDNINAQDSTKSSSKLDYLKIFKTSQEIDDIEKALGNAKNYMNAIAYKLDIDNYGVENYYASFKQIMFNGKDDCDGRAVVGYSLLYKFHPYIFILSEDYIVMENDSVYRYGEAHAEVFIKESNMFYIPGINENKGISTKQELIDLITNSLKDSYKIKWTNYLIGRFEDLDVLLNDKGDIKDKMRVLEKGEIQTFLNKKD